jgi:nitrogen fixation NifU-like protein
MNEQWKALILDHYKHPRHYENVANADFSSEQHNRTCGDNVKVFATLDNEHAKAQFRFIGAGCSLCLASASLMMELVDGKSIEELGLVRDEFLKIWEEGAPEAALDTWKALDGLRSYPVRSRCVKLAWQALDEIFKEWQAKV